MSHASGGPGFQDTHLEETMDLPEYLSDVTTLLVLIGGLLLVVGLVGGGMEIKEIRVPRLHLVARVFCVVIGLGLMGASFYFHVQTPAAPAPGPAATGTVAAQAELHDTGVVFYRICYVAADDPDGGLNVREQPGVGVTGDYHRVLGTIPHDARAVKYLGQRAMTNNWYWYFVSYDRMSGWVNSSYLCPDHGECTCRG